MKFQKILSYFFLIFLLQSCVVFSQNSRASKTSNESKIHTSDINNFYNAFDLALQDSANVNKIFKKEYFSKGTKGLKDFYKQSIKDRNKFSKFVIKHQEFYSSIRNDITNIESLKAEIYSYFESFKNLYPKAVFPDVYFVIGRFQSNAITTKKGLLIGTEVICRTDSTNTKNWNKEILRISMLKAHIPITVSHELVHFNQFKMEETSTLLYKCIREGSAEFIAELICGETDGDYSKFKGKELEIWSDFLNDKDKSIWNTWTSWHQGYEKRPRNAGYWAGYLICKAYYTEADNKLKAVHDILNIKDYSAFYEKSNVRNYIKENYK